MKIGARWVPKGPLQTSIMRHRSHLKALRPSPLRARSRTGGAIRGAEPLQQRRAGETIWGAVRKGGGAHSEARDAHPPNRCFTRGVAHRSLDGQAVLLVNLRRGESGPLREHQDPRSTYVSPCFHWNLNDHLNSERHQNGPESSANHFLRTKNHEKALRLERRPKRQNPRRCGDRLHLLPRLSAEIRLFNSDSVDCPLLGNQGTGGGCQVRMSGPPSQDGGCVRRKMCPNDFGRPSTLVRLTATKPLTARRRDTIDPLSAT
jgi:hypothetical protein